MLEMNNEGTPAVDFDMLVEGYREQIDALVEGGVDLLLVETAFDTLNVKAALSAAEEVFTQRSQRMPVMLSVTIADE